MKYNVLVTRDTRESTTIQVDALSKDHAIDLALGLANDGNHYQWDIDDDFSSPYLVHHPDGCCPVQAVTK